MRFVLFKGQSQYGSLRLHVDQLATALSRLGHAAGVIDLTAEGRHEPINAALADPPDAFIGFSGLGADIQADGVSVYDRIGRPYVSLYVDHPAHLVGRLSLPIARKIAFFLDRSHVQFMSQWSVGRGFAHLGFLPPGANTLPDPVDTSDAAFAARDIPLLFTGTYRGQPAAPWREWPDNPARIISEAVAERMTADARLPVLDALRGALSAHGAELTPQLFDDFVPLLMAPQLFAEAYHRDALLHTLGRAGVEMHVYGSGWEPLAARYPSFRYGGVGSFEETLHLIRRTRIVLNTNNGFVAGGHERVFTAMCGGAAVFSDESRFYADAFKEGREIATFAWRRLDKVPDQLGRLMADEAGLATMARAGAKRAMAEHTWDDRAAKLVKAVRQAG